jgi:hypothetical protein
MPECWSVLSVEGLSAEVTAFDVCRVTESNCTFDHICRVKLFCATVVKLTVRTTVPVDCYTCEVVTLHCSGAFYGSPSMTPIDWYLCSLLSASISMGAIVLNCSNNRYPLPCCLGIALNFSWTFLFVGGTGCRTAQVTCLARDVSCDTSACVYLSTDRSGGRVAKLGML